ncbi:MAG: hypothetical protein QF796_00905 [Acidimicrobiales bacterium]|jgi:hypothetical protein|uniref:Uncharacterized protein n=1 Tax=marine metagenome TaxID=408172 RepID=A0A382QNV0_9ZZZZ|nr:hypothetical protein [Actinomycetes bacterium]MDP6104984.1 hypothetical protein [Acidimicrobiales bacterium]MDP6239583.1 hypothetical protein [Acidimicrobiales bacterium]MDP6493544.1 hypothetical protein [Acidimicrobiales bacterium]MDP6648675.1 hypothetical protein [Acidimicrobiales bacterium]|tara:strand:- start:41 stop:232 length:192 start_codon:yes stop_codon:yes gene_type:complete
MRLFRRRPKEEPPETVTLVIVDTCLTCGGDVFDDVTYCLTCGATFDYDDIEELDAGGVFDEGC